MELEYLPINTANIKKKPDRFSIVLAGDEYIFRVYFNEQDRRFYFDMFDVEEDPIIEGKRIAYGRDLFFNVNDERIPAVRIILFDKSGEEEANCITEDNFMDPVLPYIVPREV